MASPAANLVNLERVHKSYGIRPLLDGVSLGVGAGERIGVVGRNGDGKTTLLRIIGGLEDVDQGRVSRSRGLHLGSDLVQENHAVPCDPTLRHQLLDAIEAVAGTRRELPSGAGHDAVMMATAMPVGMVFVRCRNGLSHHPDEYASPEDIAVALKVLVEFLKRVE